MQRNFDDDVVLGGDCVIKFTGPGREGMDAYHTMTSRTLSTRLSGNIASELNSADAEKT
jgi:hypothetical protein